MHPVSVVIITLNEEKNIVPCIRSARQVSDDVIVVDSGSSDLTLDLARSEGARIYHLSWQGYGNARNYGAEKARNPWIFALDADERITPLLANSMNHLDFSNPNHLYKFRRINFIGNRKIRFGTLGFETVTRIYHSKITRWDNTLVHEKLEAHGTQKKMIQGNILHEHLSYASFQKKSRLYAILSAEKYALQRKKTMPFKKFLSPFFNAVKSYLIQLGFLDGKLGWQLASNIASYSWWKYEYLQQMNSSEAVATPFLTSTRQVNATSV